MIRANIRLGDVLIKYGYITQDQLTEALSAQRQDATKRIGEILMELGYITESHLLDALSERLSLQVLDLAMQPLDLACVALIPKALCLKYGLIAISRTEHAVTLAVNDPLDFYAIEDVKTFFEAQCELVLCRKADILNAVNRAYSEIEARNAANIVHENQMLQALDDNEDFEANAARAPIVNLVNSLVMKGYMEGASDVHFEPFEKQLRIRLRIDGQLLDYMTLEPGLIVSISTRIKILADLDIAERRIPQDGNFKMQMADENVGVRVSTIPTPFGEKIVLRFLARDVMMDNADHYGMEFENYRKIARILQNPHGIVYITGPTGSGKTTTLYMMVDRLARQPVNVSTIEDPIERNLPGVTQVQVNTKAGLTFSSGLRSMLRQDPDIILVGETRDAETAQIAVSAAITGHLVLSTLHTNDSIGTIARLQDMGVASYLVASSLVGVVAQRLVKKVCPNCRYEYEPGEDEKALLPSATKLVRGRGCNACSHSGYKGRIAVHEILEIDKDLRVLISNDATSEEIYQHVQKTGKMSTIRDNVRELTLSGVTTIDEYIKNTSMMH